MKKKKSTQKKKWIVVIVLLCMFLVALPLRVGNEEKTQNTDFAEQREETVWSDALIENENQEEQQENTEETDSWIEKIINQFRKPKDKVDKSEVSDSGNKNQIQQSEQLNADKEDSNKGESNKGDSNKEESNKEDSNEGDSDKENSDKGDSDKEDSNIEDSKEEEPDKEEPDEDVDKPDVPAGDEPEKEEPKPPVVNPPTAEERGELEIQEKNNMSYEEALAANTVAAVYMLYPEFEIKEVYLTGETLISNKKDSAGVYVVFEQDGEQMTVHAASLEEERNESDTVDVYTIDMGYSTFDLVSSGSIDETTMKKMELEKLDELIRQTVLVTVYEH